MFKNLRLIAPAAIILATLATTVQARQIDSDAPKSERVAAQTVAKAQAQSPYFWLVLGVGY